MTNWSGSWSNEPVAVQHDGDHLLVTCREGSDAWRRTSYGFVHDSEHALLRQLSLGSAVEVVFQADLHQQFDQAGLFLSYGPEHWVKAGCEFSDGQLFVGSVVTHHMSDWSVAPVDWSGRRVRIRASWTGDAVTIRAGLDGEHLGLVRVAPFIPDGPAQAGPMACAPTRSGLRVRFTQWVEVEADAALHP